ncbi:MAG TPA: hypothetical protein VJ325_05585, partial [Thiobacillus sp.]|nr:hypothetical protein [Thiobacillus sp.]
APIKTAPAASATLVANDRFAGINPDSSVTKNIGRMKAYADGGSVTDTVRLKNKHTEAYSTGETDKQFGPWLEENGYQLGDDGQVKPKGDAKVIAQKQPDTRPRTPDFLFKPRVYQNKPKNYAEGGLVDVAPVALESEDFIVPEDVVRAVGTVYLDKLVEGGVA